MKTIIAGSRLITDYKILLRVLNHCKFDITEVVCGCAKGVDTLGEIYACENNIPIKLFPANWATLNKGAGFIRNQAMAEYAEACIIIRHEDSKGSKDMQERATKEGLKTFVVVL